MIRQKFKQELQRGTMYQLTFKVRARDIRAARWSIGYFGYQPGTLRVQRQDRGAAQVTRDSITERRIETGTFSAGDSWSTVTKTFRVDFENAALKDVLKSYLSGIELRFTLKPQAGVIYIDDVQLVAKR